MLHWPENHSTLLTIYFLIHIFQMMLIDFPNQTSFSCIGYQILLLTLVIHSAMQFLFRVPLKPSVVQKRREFCNPSRFHSVHATQAFVPAWHWHLWCPSAAIKNAPKFTWYIAALCGRNTNLLQVAMNHHINLLMAACYYVGQKKRTQKTNKNDTTQGKQVA